MKWALMLLALALLLCSCTPRVSTEAAGDIIPTVVDAAQHQAGHLALIHWSIGFLILGVILFTVLAVATPAKMLCGTIAVSCLAGIIAAQFLATIWPLLPYITLAIAAVVLLVLGWYLYRTWLAARAGMRAAQRYKHALEEHDINHAERLTWHEQIDQGREGSINLVSKLFKRNEVQP